MRKRFVGCALAAMMILGTVCQGAVTAPQAVEKVPVELSRTDDSVKPSSISKSGRTLKISLKGNQTTGYDWTAKVKDSSILKLTKTDYVADAHKQGMAGYGGKRTFKFKGLKKGTTVIVFTYARSWEKDKPASSCKVKVRVNAKGKILSADVVE